MSTGTRWDNWVPGPTCGLNDPQGFTDASWIMYMSQIIAETHATARAMWKEELEQFVDQGELPQHDHLLGPNEAHQDIQDYLEFMGLLTTEDTHSNINAHRKLAEELARRAAEESAETDIFSRPHARSALERFILFKLLKIFKPGSSLSPAKLWLHFRRRTRSIPKVIRRGTLKHSKMLLSSMRITRASTPPTPSPSHTSRETPPPRQKTLSNPQPFTQKLETSKPRKAARRMTVDDSKTVIAQKRRQEMTGIEDKKVDSVSLKSSSSATVVDFPLQSSSPILPSRSWQCSLRTMPPPEWIITPSPFPSPFESNSESYFESDSPQFENPNPSTPETEGYPVQWYHILLLISTFFFVGISFFTFLLIRSVFCFAGISRSERFVNVCIITGCVLSLGKFFQVFAVHY